MSDVLPARKGCRGLVAKTRKLLLRQSFLLIQLLWVHFFAIKRKLLLWFSLQCSYYCC